MFSLLLIQKSAVIDKIGSFTYGSNWLEFQNHMETCFDEKLVPQEYHKEICLDIIKGKTLKVLKAMLRPQTIEDDAVDYNTIVQKLETHFYPHPDKTFYRTKFMLRKQRRRETFFQYVSHLRKMIPNCSFGKTQHSKLRNQIIEGAVSSLREKFNPHSMSFSAICEIGLLWDDSRTIKAALHPRNHNARKNRTPSCFRCKMSISRVHETGQECPFDWAICSHCNVKGHVSIACKYKDFDCNNCGQKGHVAKLCKKVVVKAADGPGETSLAA